MDPRAHPDYRTPSPGHPLQQGYQLDEHPYGQHQQHNAFDAPPVPGQHPQRYGTPSDHLNIHTPVSYQLPLADFPDARHETNLAS